MVERILVSDGFKVIFEQLAAAGVAPTPPSA